MHGYSSKFLSRSAWFRAQWFLIYSIDLDLSSAFNCPTCGSFQDAPILIMDGMTLGTRSVFLPQPSTRLTNTAVPPRQGSLYSNRVLFSFDFRRRLLAFASYSSRKKEKAPFIQKVCSSRLLRFINYRTYLICSWKREFITLSYLS